MPIRSLIISYITDKAPSRPDIELIIGLKKQGVEVDVIIPPGASCIKVFKEMGIGVITAHPNNKFSLTAIRLIRKEIKERQYQILHLFNTKAITNGSLAALGLPVKVIAYRGAAGIYWYDPTAWFAHLNPRVNYIICNSAYVQQHMRRQLILRSKKAVMIHKGMDINWFNEIKPFDRATLGLPQNAIIVGCVANVRPVKGIPYLLKATYHMDAQTPIYIMLIGHGTEQKDIKKLIDESPLKNRILIMGFRKDVYSLVAACDIYVQPSLSESLSRSVMEAMSLKIPCIVSNTGGLIELIEDGKSGIVVEKADAPALARAILQLSSDADRRKKYAGEAFNRMKTIFSVDNMVMNTFAFYKKIV